MRQLTQLLTRLTSGHKVVLSGAGILLLAVMIFSLGGSTKPVLALLGLLSVLSLGAIMVYLSILSGRLERQERRVLRQGQVILARLDTEKQGGQSYEGGPVPAHTGVGGFAAGEHWAQRIAGSATILERFVKQTKKTRSFGARNVLAYAATRGRMDWRDMALLLAARRLNSGDKRVLNAVEGIWIPGALRLARVLFCQRIREDDLHNALALYEAVIEQQGWSVLDPVDCSYVADLLVTFSRQSEVPAVLSYERETTENQRLAQELLKLNAANSFIKGGQPDEQEWLRQLNSLLSSGGLRPLELAEGPEPAFYRLYGRAEACGTELPLVTVIMPIYCPDRSTSAAVDSLLAQTWNNLEIIMVDDGSPTVGEDGQPTNYRTALQDMAGRDTRIRLILNEENRGAYWARNVAYASATGKYVTVADKDDWHHPQKIELQARDLELHQDRPANMVQWSRVDEDLRFLFRWGPDRIIHPSFASIMYRREEVQSKLGYWDSVRKSADNEFRMRLQAVYGDKIVLLGELPLAFSLLGESNLTSQDFGLGFEQPERRMYRHAYESWHRAIAVGDESPYLEMAPEIRKFLAPGEFLPVQAKPPRLDVVYVSDYEYSDRESRALSMELGAAVAEGLSVGVVPSEAFMSPRSRGLGDRGEVEELIAKGTVTQMALSQEGHASLVVVRDPVIFQVARDAPAALTAERIVIRAETGPVEHATGFRHYDVGTVEETARNVLGMTPKWGAVTAPVRDELQRLVPGERMEESLLPDYVGNVVPRSAHTPSSRMPVLGRHMPEDVDSWPATKNHFHSVFSSSAGLPVRVLGTAQLPRSRYFSGELPEHWILVDGGSVPVGDFLDSIDFLIHFPAAPDKKDTFEIAEAMAHGVVCILPPSHASIFEDAAVYCDPDEVGKVIREIWQDPYLYQAKQQQGMALVAGRGSTAADLLPLVGPAHLARPAGAP